jgi:2-polyprenyl-6-methoxyphenol hydroxylase-like FAD-dependent oxidoreductase
MGWNQRAKAFLSFCPEVAVIGAGPVGCVTALAFAHRGRRVLLLEGNPRSAHRLAGECLHPAGVKVLEQLGQHDLIRDSNLGRGFAVFPHDGSTPIFLNYPEGANGLTCEHFLLVSTLRQAASCHANIDLLPGAQATAIAGQELFFDTPDQPGQSVVAELIVGADGRSSLARKCLNLPDERSYISSMAGVLLEDVDLCHDGYGHVILGGPGPVLACRIGPRRVRLFLDLPPRGIKKDAASLWDAFGTVLHPEWRAPFRKALEGRPVTWASNQWRPRLHYGRPGLALVGDAVGHYHPLTAVGLTLGFLDAACLAESKTFADYRRQRTAQCGVAQLLAYSLYRVFTHDDPGTQALRSAIFQIWRQSPAECRRTMRLLSGEETEISRFNRAFLRVLTSAFQRIVQESFLAGDWLHTARAFGGFSHWLGWLATRQRKSEIRISNKEIRNPKLEIRNKFE